MVAAIRAGVEQDGCDGVLLLHGTDTLAYSAAALSFPITRPAGTGSAQRLNAPGRRRRQRCLGQSIRCHARAAGGCYAGRAAVLSMAHCCTARGSASCACDAFDAFHVLPRQRHSARAKSLPARIDYRQPRQPVNLAVIAVLPWHPSEPRPRITQQRRAGLIVGVLRQRHRPSG